MMKSCSRCGESKPSEAFYAEARGRSGLSARCKICVRAADAAYRRANLEKTRAASAAWRRANPEKQAAASAAWRRANPGRNAAVSAARRRANPEKYAAAKAAWRRANTEKIAVKNAVWRRANPEKKAAAEAAWRRANPEKQAAKDAKRNAAKLQRTPPWLNQAHLAEIDGIYHFSNVMEQITGQKYHVDHREPIQGKDVSGLHVPWNLRAIPARENLVKSNRRI